MGLFDGRSSSYQRSSSYHGQTSHSPSRSSHGAYTRPSYARSASSFFSTGGSTRGYGGSSYYKRRPRDGYISFLMHKLQRMIKELWYYARRHPVKAFFAVIVPLLSAGGAIGGLLKGFGIRLPAGLGGSSRSYNGGYYGSSGYESRGGGGGGLMDNAGSLMQIARAFM